MHPENRGSKQEKGAITVFLALVFTSLILFAGMVIDISRIAAADRKVQSILNSSARSVLAGYDNELVGGYGIYGINAASDKIEDDFYRYMSVNLKEGNKGISLMDIEVAREDVEIRGMDNLLEEEPFKRQIQEYMKYRTVINAYEGLVKQLKNIKLDKKLQFAQSEKAVRGKARTLRAKISTVNGRLEGIKKNLSDISAEKLEDMKKELTDTLSLSNSIYGEYRGFLEEYNDSVEDSKLKAKEGDCIENQSLEFGNIQSESVKLVQTIKKYVAEVSATQRVVEPLQKELEPLKEELKQLKHELSDLKHELSELDESEEASPEDKHNLKEEINEIKEEIDEVEDDIRQLEDRIERAIKELMERLAKLPLEGYNLKDEAVRLTVGKIEELKNSIARIKREIEGSLLRSLKKEWMISAEEFDTDGLIAGEDFGVMNEKFDYDLSIKEQEAEKENEMVMANVEKLARAIEAAAAGTVEKINTIEYVMDNFTFLTSKTERNHYFGKGEVEYILCGADTAEGGNTIRNSEYYLVANVFMQVWALRFAIDTIDDFVRSAIVFPPQRLAFALAEGALDSSMDMLDLMKGQGVSLCPKSFAGIKLKYSDHLRILLLLKPEDEILRKARQLMQVNIKQLVDLDTERTRSDFRLGDYSTLIAASVEARINLFFLPILKVDKLMPESFQGGRFVIRKKVYVGY